MIDGAHTHRHGPSGLGELVVLAFGVILAAGILARVLTLLLIVLAVAGGLLLIGFIGYVVAACRRYRQQDIWLNAVPRGWPGLPGDPPRAVLDDPVTLRQAITELQAQFLAARGGLPAADRGQHQHLHFHGLAPSRPPPSSLNCKPASTALAGRTEGAHDRAHHPGRPARSPHHQ